MGVCNHTSAAEFQNMSSCTSTAQVKDVCSCTSTALLKVGSMQLQFRCCVLSTCVPVHLLLMLRTCDSTSAEVKELCSCAVKEMCTYYIFAVFKDVCGHMSTADVKDVFVLLCLHY